jgi:dienelactone hydrolase
MIHSQILDYYADQNLLKGYLAYDKSKAQPQPAVLIAPAWDGRTGFVESKARALASQGYVGFALDIYGEGKTGSSVAENSELMQPFIDDRSALLKRLQAAYQSVKALPQVDANKVAAIGYCFGGLCVLDLARSGAELAGVASFHGLLTAPSFAIEAPIRSKILILHGHDDPLVPAEQVAACQAELTKRQADWQMHIYGHAQHAFTRPDANDSNLGTLYNKAADRRSNQALDYFLTELFDTNN